jgi:hypothetical protein
VGGSVAEELFQFGLCIPSGSGMTALELERVADVVRSVHRAAAHPAHIVRAAS